MLGTSRFVIRHIRTIGALLFVFLYSASISLATPPVSKYSPGDTLDPLCTPGSTNCSVQILPTQTGNTNKLLTTSGSVTSWTDTLTGISLSGATNTLSNIGNASLTNSTISINGTPVALGGSVSNLALTTNPLSQFAATTSSQLAGVITDETGTGTVVYSVSPTLTGTIAAQNATFSGNIGVGIAAENTYQGITLYGSNPSVRLKGDNASSWNWIEYVTSAGVNNFSSGVNQTTPYYGIKAGSGLDNPSFSITSAGDVALGSSFNGISFAGATMVVRASGNVGIGTTTPDATGFGWKTLTIKGGANAGEAGVLELQSGASTVNDQNLGIIAFLDGANRYAQIGAKRESSGAAYLSFYTGGILSERMRIDSTGNIVIADLIGSGNRCVYADSTGQLNVKGFDCGSASGGDNLGDHTATQNVLLNGNWLSNDGGAEGLRIDNSGNVGIGTTTPARIFTINGGASTSRVLLQNTTTGSSIGNGFDIFEDTSGVAGLWNYYNGAMRFATNNLERMRIAADGKVGIGTAAPLSKLEVVGASSAADGSDQQGLMQLSTGTGVNSDNKLLFGIQDGDYSWIQAFNPTISARNLVLNGFGGNVGVGTTAPSQKLDVEIQTTSGANGSVLNSYPIADFINAASGGGARGLQIGAPTGSVTSPVYLKISGTSARFALLNQSDVENFTVIENGNTGIGVTAPLDKVSIAGNVGFYNTSGDGVANTVLGTIGARVRSYGTTTNASFANISILTDPTTWYRGVITFSTNGVDGTDGATPPTERMRITSDGNVGIGTTTPALQSAGTGLHINATTSSELKFTNGTTAALATDGTALVSNGLNFTINNRENGNFILGTNNVERIRILADGNAGIGTATPGTKTEIQRVETVNRTTYNDILTLSANATTNPFDGHGGGILFKGTTYQSGTGNVNYARIGSTINSNSINSYGSNLFFDVAPLSDGALTRAMTINYNGNVGIGTVSPETKLHIFKGAAFTPTGIFGQSAAQTHLVMQGGEPQLVFSGDMTSAGTQSGTEVMSAGLGFNYIGSNDFTAFRIGTDSAHDVQFRTSNAVRMTILSDGNVGIGTTTPAYKLDVNGTGNFAGALSGTSAAFTGTLSATMGTFTRPVYAGTNSANYTVSMGGSGGDYGSVGYGQTYTSTTGVYNYRATDYSSMLKFQLGGFQFNTAPSGTSGNPITYTQRAFLDNSGSFTLGSTNGTGTGALYAGSGTFTGSVQLTSNSSSISTTYGGVTTMYQLVDASGGILKVDGDNQIRIVTNNVDRFHISSSGAVFSTAITTGGDILIPDGQAIRSGLSYGANLISRGTGAGAVITIGSGQAGDSLSFSSGGSSRMTISTAGALTVSALVSCGGIQTNGSGTMSCTSDERLKDVQGDFSVGLSAIRQINPKAFSWKADSDMYDNGVIYNGFIAQNIQAAIPEAVTLSSDGVHLQVSQLTLLAATINAIKELDIKVQAIPNFEDIALYEKIATFLEGIANGIAGIGKVQTDELCVGTTCVTQEEFLQMVQSAGVQPASTTPPEPDPVPLVPDPEPLPDPTPAPEPDPVPPTPDPEPAPEPIPEPAP